jgi:hypothetical protein
MADIIVTTPKSEMKNAELEAEAAKKDGGGFYFRTLPSKPKSIKDGSRIFYVEDGYIRGFCSIDHLEDGDGLCDVTNRHWHGAVKAMMPAASWKWIKPIPMKGFQGWRYYEPPKDMKIVGGWKDPRPEVGDE